MKDSSDSASAAQCSGVRRPEDTGDIGEILLVPESRQCPDGGMGHAQTEKTSGKGKAYSKKENKAFLLRRKMLHFDCRIMQSLLIENVKAIHSNWQKSVQNETLLSKMVGTVTKLAR